MNFNTYNKKVSAPLLFLMGAVFMFAPIALTFQNGKVGSDVYVGFHVVLAETGCEFAGNAEEQDACSAEQFEASKRAWAEMRQVLSVAVLRFADNLIGAPVAGITYLILTVFSFLLVMSANVLDTSIAYAINFPFIGDIARLGWGITRDIANMFLIFILLYIAISTILQLSGSDTKKLLMKLIVVALLLNFSFFITAEVVGIANSLAKFFYQGAGGTLLSVKFMQAMGAESIWGASKIMGEPAGFFNLSKTFLLATIFIAVTTFVFLAGAIMFVMRIVVLTFVVVLAPLGFLASIIPGTSGYSKQWWDALISNAFVAPVFLFFVYLITKTVTALPDGQSFAKLLVDMDFSGNGATLLLRYFVAIGLLLGAIVASQQIAKRIAGTSVKWAGRASGAGIGATAFGLRNSIGFGAKRLAGNERLQKWAAQSGFGGFAARVAHKGALGASRASFDARTQLGKVPGTSFGAASGKGGFEAQFQRGVEKREKYAADLGKQPPLTPAERAQVAGGQARLKTAQDAIPKVLERIAGAIKSGNKAEETGARNLLHLAQGRVRTEQAGINAITGRGKARMEEYANTLEAKPSFNVDRAAAATIRSDLGKSPDAKLQERLLQALGKAGEAPSTGK